MPAYNEAYLDEVVETQGKLFAYIAYDFPDMDTKDFIESCYEVTFVKYLFSDLDKTLFSV